MDINTTNFPSNSKVKEEREKPKQVTKGEVITRKRSFGRKLQDTFLADDIRDIKGYVWSDIVVPGIIDTIIDMVQNGIEMVFGVGGRRTSRSSRRRKEKYTNYSSISYNNSAKEERKYSRLNARNTDVEDVIVETRGEAEEIISNLADLCEDYGAARVADLYSMIGKTQTFTDERWGWESVSSARVTRVRGGGYLIDLPKPIFLE